MGQAVSYLWPETELRKQIFSFKRGSHVMAHLDTRGRSGFYTSGGQNVAESRPTNVFNTDLKNVLRPISTFLYFREQAFPQLTQKCCPVLYTFY